MTTYTYTRKNWPVFEFLLALGTALLLSTGVGCANPVGTFEFRRGQEQAVKTIWEDVFGETGDPPPIEWREPECKDWGNVPGVWSYNIATGQTFCHRGFHWLTGGVVVVQEWAAKYSNWVDLTHELMHAHAEHALHGDCDPLHNRMDWSQVFDAYHLLAEDGFYVHGWADPNRGPFKG